MHITTNNLRLYRKRAHLIQEDVAFISSIADYATISRIENGQAKPNLEVAIVYHLLFEMPVDTFFEDITASVKVSIVDRLKLRLENLQQNHSGSNVMKRIDFLQAVLARLTNQPL